MMRLLTISVGLGSLLAAPQVRASPPAVYRTAAYQSPVRGDPDDLLLIPGYGFSSGDTVVYSAIADTTEPLTHPATLPSGSTDALGVAEVVSLADTPYSLTIRLPEAMKVDQSYALWVVNSMGEWSNGLKINDARPLWITPDEAYEHAESAELRRVVKVVGRNLQPAPRVSTQVRLIGAHATYQLSAAISAKPAVNRYVARIHLPKQMATGSYSVQVSRDGVSWVPLIGEGQSRRQTLTVLADPGNPARFSVGNYTFGTCVPHANDCPVLKEACVPDSADQGNQTLCISAAIAAARAAGGGVVVFGPGTWLMEDAGSWKSSNSFSSKGVSYDAILVPDGVSLQGAGSAATTLLRGASWDAHLPTFALLGHNTVSGFTFRDARTYTNRESGAALLSLGVRWDRATAYDASARAQVSHVVITRNVFDKPFTAVANAGLPIDHLMVTRNKFGAFKTALSWEADPSNIAHPYHYSDSVVAFNEFFPGSYLDNAIGQGTIATELSGGYRTDFSNNVADGTSTAYLYNPQGDAKGWRAAYFWSMSDSVEMLLVSQNVATCTGDKNGDGEAIAYDNNHNRPGFFALAVPVLGATSAASSGTSTVTVRGSMIETQLSYGTSIDVRPVSDYYVGDWLQIVQGPGLGQARKITAIRTDPSAGSENVTFTVAPAFDVLPQTNGLVTDSRLFWQTYTVDNVIDHRTPSCLKSNRKRQAGGLITPYAATTDSVVEGNIQYDSSGILAAHEYKLADPKAGIGYPGTLIQSFNEIRGNTISGTYDALDKSREAEYGIAIAYGATPDARPPPTISYGLAISHNAVSRVRSSKGAISLSRSWFTGPDSRTYRGTTPWKIADATLIFKNTLTDIDQSVARGVGIGISADSAAAPVEWRSVLYGNVCSGVRPSVDMGTATVQVCRSAGTQSCECNRQPTDLAVSGTSHDAGPTPGQVTYSLVVVNNGPGSATDATLSAEPPAGLQIDSMTGPGVKCDTEDSNVNLCRLGTIRAGTRVGVTVVATPHSIGAAPVIFSVAHREADTNVNNDSVSITLVGSREDIGAPTLNR